MPDFEYAPLTETTELTAASANNRFDGAEATINDLPAEAVAPKCFQAAHLPSVVVEEGTGVTHRWVVGAGSPTTHSYSQASPGGTWYLVCNNGSAGGGTSATLTFSSSVSLANAGPIAGILVMADISVTKISMGNTDGSAGGTSNGNSFVGLRIAYQATGGGSWTGIARSERHLYDRGVDGTGDHAQNLDANIRTLITASDSSTVTAVRLEAQVFERSGGSAIAGRTVTAVLRPCQITALVIRSEKN